MSIQSMRDGSDGIVTKIIVGLIIVVFAVFGMGSITTFLSPTLKVATVNGEDITEAEMEIAFERQRGLLARQGRTLLPEDEDRLRENVIQGLIDRELMTQAVDDLDFGFSSVEIDQEILSTEAFQINGEYNSQQFQIVLAGAGYTPLKYRSELRLDKMIEQLNIGIRETGFLTKVEAQLSTALTQQKRDVAFLRLDVAAEAETIEVSEQDVSAYFDENQDDYKTEEQVDIAYVEIQRKDLLATVEINEADLQSFFEDTSDLYSEPERKQLAHILVLVSDDQSDEDAAKKATELHEQLLAGADFAELAEANSEDPGSAENGGDLGFNDPGTFVEDFEFAAAVLEIDEVSAPVKTEFGYHIIKVLDIEVAKQPALADVREKVLLEFKIAGADELFVSLSEKLSELAFESVDLDGPAIDLGLEIKHTGLVTRTSGTEIAANPQVLAAVFGADVLVDGNNSELIEIAANHHVVVRVSQHKPQVVKALTEVQTEIESRLKTERAGTLVEQKAKDALQLLETGSLARYVADQTGVRWKVVAAVTRNQREMDREINAEAFKLPRPAEGNKSVGYAVLSNGDAVVVSVTNVQNKSASDMDLEELATFTKFLAAQEGITDYREFAANLEQSGSVSR